MAAAAGAGKAGESSKVAAVTGHDRGGRRGRARRGGAEPARLRPHGPAGRQGGSGAGACPEGQAGRHAAGPRPARGRPASPPPAAVTGYTDLDSGVLGALEGSAGSTAAGTPSAGAAATGARDGGGSLPFTGLDLMLLALAGGVLVGTGLGLRRVAQAPRL